jgi:hypothetical protein
MDHLISTSYKVCHQSSASELDMVPDMTGVMMYFGGDDAPDYSPDYAPCASSPLDGARFPSGLRAETAGPVLSYQLAQWRKTTTSS